MAEAHPVSSHVDCNSTSVSGPSSGLRPVPDGAAAITTTITLTETDSRERPEEENPTLRLKLKKPKTKKKVIWTEDTVDNEHLGKKKSKCCCIYKKPRKFDESSSDESEGECDDCFGHVNRSCKSKDNPKENS